jgi:hypothetical protein
MTQTEPAHFAALRKLGFDPTGDKLVAVPPQAEEPAKPQHQPVTQANEVVLAPPGMDPRTMPVDEIEFDPRLLDNFPSLKFSEGGSAASRYIFDLYKSYTKDPLRNGALQRKITSFITTTRRNRQSGGIVTEQVKTTVDQRDTAAILAASGYDSGQTAEAIRIREALKAAGVDVNTLLNPEA